MLAKRRFYCQFLSGALDVCAFGTIESLPLTNVRTADVQERSRRDPVSSAPSRQFRGVEAAATVAQLVCDGSDFGRALTWGEIFDSTLAMRLGTFCVADCFRSKNDNEGSAAMRTREPAYITDFRALIMSGAESDNFEQIECDLYVSGSDRATAILFGSLVEDHLGRLLTSNMRVTLNSDDRYMLFGGNGPLATFSSKIIISYAMKLIGHMTRCDLDLIRNLRNGFAHSRMPLSFDAPEVRALCDKFQIVDQPGTKIPFKLLNSLAQKKLKIATDKSHPKARYISACHNISYRLQVKRFGFREGDQVFPNNDPVP